MIKNLLVTIGCVLGLVFKFIFEIIGIWLGFGSDDFKNK